MNFYPFSEDNLVKAYLKMDSGMSTDTLCVGMSLSALWQRGRMNLTPNGGKYPETVPTFQLCDLLSAHRYSQMHAPHFQGQIQLQACGIKVNRLGYCASSNWTPNVHKDHHKQRGNIHNVGSEYFRQQQPFFKEGEWVKYTQGGEVEEHVGITVPLTWIFIQHPTARTLQMPPSFHL